MKRIAVLALLLPLAGCVEARPPDTRIGRDVGTAPGSVQSPTSLPPPGTTPQPAPENVAAERRRAEQDLAGIEGDLKTLKERARVAGAQARQQLQPTIDALEKEAAATRARLAELGNQGAEAWRAARPSVNRALEDLRQAYRKAADKFNPK